MTTYFYSAQILRKSDATLMATVDASIEFPSLATRAVANKALNMVRQSVLDNSGLDPNIYFVHLLAFNPL